MTRASCKTDICFF